MAQYLVARANALLTCLLVVVLCLVGGAAWERLDAARTARAWSQHSYEVLGTLQDLEIAVRDAETGQRGFLLTGADDYLAPYQAALGRVGFLEGELQRLTADNPSIQDELRALSPPVARKLEELAQTVELRRDVGLEAAMALVRTGSGRLLMTRIEASLAGIGAQEHALLDARLAQSDSRAQWVRWLLAAGTALSVAILLWAARLLNQAWRRSSAAEARQRVLALQLRTSLDSLSQGVAVFGPDHGLRHWNDCFGALLGLPRALVRQGTPYAALAEHAAAEHAGAHDGEAERAGLLETAAQVRRGRGQPGLAVVFEAAGADGRHLEVRRTAMPDAGFVLTVTDMTRRAQAEAVLRESQKMQAIGQLTGGIAHDFNNLLTVILGNLEFASARLAGEPALQARIGRAAWAAQRGAALTGQLLSFARRQPLAPKPIDLAAAMPELVPLLRRTLGEHIEIRYVETAGLWPALADAAQLESAVLNLALNARDAMPGGGRLTIELANKVLDDDYARAHAEVTAGEYAMLAVSDTGCGMTPEVAARVFEPFFTTKPEGSGTGLGLAMVFGFVRQSGGHVKIHSAPGEGTTVRLYLPRPAGGATPAAASAASRAPAELPRGSACVLVVEDDAAVREIACAILGELGYRVLEAADGEEALRTFGAHAAAVDLLLTDMVLPGPLRGRDVAERVAAMRPEVRVLFMSGYAEDTVARHGQPGEDVPLIGKPFRREQLARKVAEVLGGAGEDTRNVVAMRARRDG
ncbi:MAG: CHASE3 domain-containing protein [Janthinobacterium lividum]